MMKNILVRADDLGYSKGINYGIYESVHRGLINNVGFMVNMEDSIHGYELIKNEDVDLGLHTVICAGRPISNPELVPSLVTNSGEFKPSKIYRSAKEDFVVLEEVMIEIEAQYLRFVKITGRKPDYFEGHAVESENFVEGMRNIAQKYDVPFLGFSFEKEIVVFKNSKLRPLMYSQMPNYHPKKILADLIESDEDKIATPMLICHPGYLDEYITSHSSLLEPRMYEVEMACDTQLIELAKQHQVHFVRYSELS